MRKNRFKINLNNIAIHYLNSILGALFKSHYMHILHVCRFDPRLTDTEGFHMTISSNAYLTVRYWHVRRFFNGPKIISTGLLRIDFRN